MGGKATRDQGADPFVIFEGRPVPIRKVLCVGRNYAAHAGEMAEDVPGEPILFLKPATALVRPNGGDLFIPKEYGLLHHEVELVLLLGGGGRTLQPETAGRFVRGYGVGLDLTLRDMQSEAKRAGAPWTLAKGFDGSAPVGDFVRAEEVENPRSLGLSLEINGATRQEANTSAMIFTPEEIISYASRFMTLEEGDLILTGTPEGVGPLVDGDSVAARIEGLPELRFTVRR